MKLTTAALTTSIFTTTTLAQSGLYNETSAPFDLILISSNSTINGSALFPCHIGAAEENLCWLGSGPTNTSVYNFNTSSEVPAQNATAGQPGLLTWTLEANAGTSDPIYVSEPLGLNVDYTSDVAMTFLSPSSTPETVVAFDSNNLLNIQGYGGPGAAASNYTPSAYYNWYLCYIDYAGYNYDTLAWVIGGCVPDNPTCQPVDVVRVFT